MLLEVNQIQLIYRFVETLLFNVVMDKFNCTPSEANPWVKDEDGFPICKYFGYSSVVVMIFILLVILSGY